MTDAPQWKEDGVVDFVKEEQSIRFVCDTRQDRYLIPSSLLAQVQREAQMRELSKCMNVLSNNAEALGILRQRQSQLHKGANNE